MCDVRPLPGDLVRGPGSQAPLARVADSEVIGEGGRLGGGQGDVPSDDWAGLGHLGLGAEAHSAQRRCELFGDDLVDRTGNRMLSRIRDFEPSCQVVPREDPSPPCL